MNHRSTMNEREKELLEAFYLKENKSIRDIADLLGWKKDKVHRLLKQHGIKRDKGIRKGKLTGITLEYLEKEFKKKTKVQVAKELSVSRPALYKHLKKMGHPRC